MGIGDFIQNQLIVVFLHKIIFAVFMAGRLSDSGTRVGLPCGFSM